MPLPVHDKSEKGDHLRKGFADLMSNVQALQERVTALVTENTQLRAQLSTKPSEPWKLKVNHPDGAELRLPGCNDSDVVHRFLSERSDFEIVALESPTQSSMPSKDPRARDQSPALRKKMVAFPPMPDEDCKSREPAEVRQQRSSGGGLCCRSQKDKKDATHGVRQKTFAESNCLAASKMGMLKNDPWSTLGADRKRASSWGDFVDALAPKKSSAAILERLVNGVAFKTLCMLAITANTVYLGAAADFNVKNSFGPIEGRDKEPEPRDLDIAFAVWFSIEIVLRGLAERLSFFTGDEQAWNLFDTFLVLESILGLIFPFGAKLSFLRILRVFRLVRVVRVVKSVKALRRLRTMIFSIANSFIDLIWAFIVVILILFVFSIIFDNAVATYFEGVDVSDSEKVLEAREVQKMFGSLPETMISLWSAVSGGNDWMTYGELLRKIDMGDFYFMVFNFFIAFCVVGLFNVVTGVFVDSAVCSRTEDEVVQSYLDDLRATTQDIKGFFAKADEDCSGTLSFEEFRNHLQNPMVKAYFHGLDIDPEEASIIFTILDGDMNNEILIEEFVNGTMKLKGSATKLDLATLMHDAVRQSNKLDALCEYIEEQFQSMKGSLSLPQSPASPRRCFQGPKPAAKAFGDWLGPPETMT
eukprot:gb/GFBE01009542.1/.p1 GENE.gb/GFBE01009542.1/~~gb/GFBE01009542.1/.p1  ORF type:complete len:643 (+),score=135.15 gb/GFBE01009542.1/:1-1929(+)